jgi:hypothetical protein
MRAAAFSSGCRSRTALKVQCKESRIGSKPIVVPKGVNVDIKGSHLKVKVRRPPRRSPPRTFCALHRSKPPTMRRRAPRASWSSR